MPRKINVDQIEDFPTADENQFIRADNNGDLVGGILYEDGDGIAIGDDNDASLLRVVEVRSSSSSTALSLQGKGSPNAVVIGEMIQGKTSQKNILICSSQSRNAELRPLDTNDSIFFNGAGPSRTEGKHIILRGGEGTSKNGNIWLGGDASSFQDGEGVIFIRNCKEVPSNSGGVSNGGILYVENGALKFKGGAGTVTEIAPA